MDRRAAVLGALDDLLRDSELREHAYLQEIFDLRSQLEETQLELDLARHQLAQASSIVADALPGGTVAPSSLLGGQANNAEPSPSPARPPAGGAAAAAEPDAAGCEAEADDAAADANADKVALYRGKYRKYKRLYEALRAQGNAAGPAEPPPPPPEPPAPSPAALSTPTQHVSHVLPPAPPPPGPVAGPQHASMYHAGAPSPAASQVTHPPDLSQPPSIVQALKQHQLLPPTEEPVQPPTCPGPCIKPTSQGSDPGLQLQGTTTCVAAAGGAQGLPGKAVQASVQQAGQLQSNLPNHSTRTGAHDHVSMHDARAQAALPGQHPPPPVPPPLPPPPRTTNTAATGPDAAPPTSTAQQPHHHHHHLCPLPQPPLPGALPAPTHPSPPTTTSLPSFSFHFSQVLPGTCLDEVLPGGPTWLLAPDTTGGGAAGASGGGGGGGAGAGGAAAGAGGGGGGGGSGSACPRFTSEVLPGTFLEGDVLDQQQQPQHVAHSHQQQQQQLGAPVAAGTPHEPRQAVLSPPPTSAIRSPPPTSFVRSPGRPRGGMASHMVTTVNESPTNHHQQHQQLPHQQLPHQQQQQPCSPVASAALRSEPQHLADQHGEPHRLSCGIGPGSNGSAGGAGGGELSKAVPVIVLISPSPGKQPPDQGLVQARRSCTPVSMAFTLETPGIKGSRRDDEEQLVDQAATVDAAPSEPPSSTNRPLRLDVALGQQQTLHTSSLGQLQTLHTSPAAAACVTEMSPPKAPGLSQHMNREVRDGPGVAPHAAFIKQPSLLNISAALTPRATLASHPQSAAATTSHIDLQSNTAQVPTSPVIQSRDAVHASASARGQYARGGSVPRSPGSPAWRVRGAHRSTVGRPAPASQPAASQPSQSKSQTKSQSKSQSKPFSRQPSIYNYQGYKRSLPAATDTIRDNDGTDDANGDGDGPRGPSHDGGPVTRQPEPAVRNTTASLSQSYVGHGGKSAVFQQVAAAQVSALKRPKMGAEGSSDDKQAGGAVQRDALCVRQVDVVLASPGGQGGHSKAAIRGSAVTAGVVQLCQGGGSPQELHRQHQQQHQHQQHQQQGAGVGASVLRAPQGFRQGSKERARLARQALEQAAAAQQAAAAAQQAAGGAVQAGDVVVSSAGGAATGGAVAGSAAAGAVAGELIDAGNRQRTSDGDHVTCDRSVDSQHHQPVVNGHNRHITIDTTSNTTATHAAATATTTSNHQADQAPGAKGKSSGSPKWLSKQSHARNKSRKHAGSSSAGGGGGGGGGSSNATGAAERGGGGGTVGGSAGAAADEEKQAGGAAGSRKRRQLSWDDDAPPSPPIRAPPHRQHPSGLPAAQVQQLPRWRESTEARYAARVAAIASSAGGAGGVAGDDDGGAVQLKEVKYAEVVRGKEARQALAGYSCDSCRAFYKAMAAYPQPPEVWELLVPGCGHAASRAQAAGEEQGAVLEQAFIQASSRHRARYVPPSSTPDGFWHLGFAGD